MIFSRNLFLDSASNWEVDPSTRCVVCPFFNDEFISIAENHAKHGDRLFKRRNPKLKAKYQDDVPELSHAQLAVAAKFEHELDHLQRHLYTSYGLLLHRIRSRMVDLFFEQINHTEEGEGQLPWYDATKTNPEFDIYSDRPRQRNRSLYLSYQWLYDMLSCGSTSPFVPSPEQCRLALESFSADLFAIYAQPGIGPASNSLVSTLPELCAPLVSTRFEFPVLPSRGREPARLGGQGLLESFAIVREISALSFAGGQSVRDAQLLRIAAYNQAFLAWKEWAGLPQSTILEPSPNWRAAGYENLEVFPLTFYAVADLALWTPVGPNGVILAIKKQPLAWHDIHPGWRFIKLLTLLRDSWGPVMAPTKIDDVTDSWLREIQNAACDDLGWPNPDTISDAWFSFLRSAHSAQSSNRFFLEDDSARLAATLNCLEGRKKHPAWYGLGFPASYASPVNWFECVFTSEERHFYADESLEMRLLQYGYPLPVSYALLQATELFGEKLAKRREEMSATVIAKLKRLGPKLERCVSNYAKRQYGVRTKFGGRIAGVLDDQ